MKKTIFFILIIVFSSFVSADIMINEFFPDPEGDDNAPMPGGEFVELYNDGDEDIDLIGAYIKDSADHTIQITDIRTIDGTIIQAKDYLAVYMNGFYGFLNNDGFEEIKLYDYGGNLTDEVNYAGSQEALSWSLVDGVWQYSLPTPDEKNSGDEPQMESSFEIQAIEDLGSDNEADFGDIIRARIHVYKGNETKSSVKLYIENDDEDDDYRISKITKATLPDMFTDYYLTLPLQIYSNCDEEYDYGEYYVNLGWTSSSKAEDTFKIKVTGINMDNCDEIYVEKEPRKGTLDYNLIEYPSTIELSEDFTVKVELTNNGEDHFVDLYSYVYRGPKCYSGEREQNKKTVLIRAGQTKEFELDNVVNEAEPGDYKLKVKIKRDDQKTEKEITKNITLLESVEIRSESLSLGLENVEEGTELTADYYNDINLIPETRLNVAYESTNLKTKETIPYFIIVFLTVFSLFLIFNKKFD